MRNHTPGPWQVTRKFEIGPTSREEDQSNGMVLPVADVFGPNREADARLIASSPVLLMALKHARTLIPHQDQEINDAIRQAEGCGDDSDSMLAARSPARSA